MLGPASEAAPPPMLLAILARPDTPDAPAAAARATGLALADVSRRLVGLLPRIVLVEVDRQRIEAARGALEAAGFAAAAFDPEVVPSDADRVIAHRLELAGDAIVVHDRRGATHRCPFGSIRLLQRGTRIASTEVTSKQTTRQLSIGRALLSGGLVLTKQVETTSTKRTEDRDAFLVVHRDDGQPDLIFYERRLDFGVLGAAKQPSSFANLERLTGLLASHAPHAPLDVRLGQPGFVAGLTRTAADPVDLAVYLVALAHLRGVA